MVETLKLWYNRIYILGQHWADYRKSWFEPTRSDGKPERLLDAGSGDAWIQTQFTRFNTQLDYYAIDLAVGDSTLEYKINALADLHHLPFKDNSFDKIMNNHVLEHVANPEIVMGEFARVLRPGGRIYLVLPMLWHLHQEPHDHYRYTIHNLRRFAEKFGFEIKHIREMGGIFTVLRYIFAQYPNFIMNRNPILKIIFWIPFQIYLLLDKTILAPIYYLLDKFDTSKKLTIGYFVEYQKKGQEEKLPEDPYCCPVCQSDNAEFQKDANKWICRKCNKIFVVTQGIPDLAMQDSLKPESEMFATPDK